MKVTAYCRLCGRMKAITKMEFGNRLTVKLDCGHKAWGTNPLKD
nr:hypothetical protein [Candidatus Njordarchaeum guaymaensis]